MCVNAVYGKSVFVLLTKNTKQNSLARCKPIKLNFRTNPFPARDHGFRHIIIVVLCYVFENHNRTTELLNRVKYTVLSTNRKPVGKSFKFLLYYIVR